MTGKVAGVVLAAWGDAERAVHVLLDVAAETSSFFRVTAGRHGLTPIEAQVVYVLAQTPSTLAVLAERAGVHKGNLSAVLDRLERDGLVLRESIPGDRRARLAVLTEVGERTTAAFLTELYGNVPLLQRLGPDQLKTLIELLA